MTKFFKCSLICILICIIVTFTGCTSTTVTSDYIVVVEQDFQTITTTYDKSTGCMTSKTIYNSVSKVTIEVTYYYTSNEAGVLELISSSTIILDNGEIIYNDTDEYIPGCKI